MDNNVDFDKMLENMGVHVLTEEEALALMNSEANRRDLRWGKLMQLGFNQKWDEFIEEAMFDHENYPDIFYNFFDKIPEEYNDKKYELLIQAYSHHGDSMPEVRKHARKARLIKEPDLPDEYKNAEYITVYRAGEEPIEKAKYRMSWTTSIDVARFFFDTYIHKHAKYLYKAKIKPAKVQAYTDDRSEKEIIQYNGVYDIELLETRITLLDYGLNEQQNVFYLKNMRDFVFKDKESKYEGSGVEVAAIKRDLLKTYMESPVGFSKKFLENKEIEKSVIFIINQDKTITVVTKKLSGDKPEETTCNSIFGDDGREHEFSNKAIGSWICEFLHLNTFTEIKDDTIVDADYLKYGLIVQKDDGLYYLISD